MAEWGTSLGTPIPMASAASLASFTATASSQPGGFTHGEGKTPLAPSPPTTLGGGEGRTHTGPRPGGAERCQLRVPPPQRTRSPPPSKKQATNPKGAVRGKRRSDPLFLLGG